MGTASLVDGTASLTYGPLSGPTRMMQASYNGDAVIMGCTSNQVVLQVGLQPPPVVDTTLWIANGSVHSIVYDAGTIYIGGSFTQVGPANGPSIERDHIAAIDATTVPQPLGIRTRTATSPLWRLMGARSMPVACSPASAG